MQDNLAFKSLIVVSILVLAACTQPSPAPTTPTQPAPTATPVELQRFSDGHFVAGYPDWPEDPNRPPESLVGVSQGPFGVWINRMDLLPDRAVRETRRVLVDQIGGELMSESTFAGHPLLEYTQPFQNVTLRYRTLFVYCQRRTYVVAVAGADQVFEQQAGLFEQVLSSARCEDPVRMPDLETGKLGMIINPARDDAAQGYYPALRLVKGAGVQVSHFNVTWAQIEPEAGQYNWNWLDFVLPLHQAEGFEVSLVVNLIHTTVRGEMPADVGELAWDDPAFIQRFTDFILALLDRYPDVIGYLSIGNEVNDYFVAHRDEVESYRTFFLAVKQAIAARHPDVKVGMTFAYHDAEAQGALDIVQRLNVGDFIPYTLYIYSSPGFRFDREPAELEGYLVRMLEVAGDKPVAIVELGWNTAASLGGSEEDQAALVREAFRLLPRHRDRILFLAWSVLHDGRPENCRNAALSFIPHRPDLAEDEGFMGTFIDFLCYLGLRENDGTPKLGWEAWQVEVEAYIRQHE